MYDICYVSGSGVSRTISCGTLKAVEAEVRRLFNSRITATAYSRVDLGKWLDKCSDEYGRVATPVAMSWKCGTNWVWWCKV